MKGGEVIIGRTRGHITLPTDTYVCPRHARIHWKNGHFWTTDLDSVNGVFVRVERPERLNDGDLLLVGLEVLRFEEVKSSERGSGQASERDTHIFGSPHVAREARLAQRTVEGLTRDTYYLRNARTSLGRELGDIVFTDDQFMSREHAALTRQQDGGYVLSDLNSSNGTFLAIRDEREMNDGDFLRIGQHLFQLRVGASH